MYFTVGIGSLYITSFVLRHKVAYPKASFCISITIDVWQSHLRYIPGTFDQGCSYRKLLKITTALHFQYWGLNSELPCV
jgi:hypothetical protein